jgi:GTPase Era involved in 16S rRNA processing
MSQATNHATLLRQLAAAEDVLKALGPEFSGYRDRLTDLRNRLAEGAFRLAVVGQFKRGKSTLLNALLGEALLPTGVLPLTSIPTILHYAPERRARVIFNNGRLEEQCGPTEVIAKVLQRHVTERENPANRLGVTSVDVDVPAGFLGKGVAIIDTPGIGSTILHNTRTAREILPACDAALFVLSPDPPITDAEVEYLKSVKEFAARIIFVLTKADLLSDAQRQELLTFISDVLQSGVGFAEPQIFVVSATQAMEARERGDPELREKSGIEVLEAFLQNLMAAEKPKVLQEAIRAKAARLLRDALFTLDLHGKALALPRQELERRWQRLQEGLAKVEQERLYFRDRLAGDRQRLLAELDTEAGRLGQLLRGCLWRTARRTQAESSSRLSLDALSQTVQASLSEEVQRSVSEIRQEVFATFTGRLKAVQDPHCRQVSELVERVRRTAADLFEVPYVEAVPLTAWETLREPGPISHREVTSFAEHALLWFMKYLPPPWKAKKFEEWLATEIEYLAARNIENVRWPTRQNLEDAVRRFQGGIDEQLEAILSSVREAVRSAVERQADREERYGGEVRRLEQQRSRVEHLLNVLTCGELSSSAPI